MAMVQAKVKILGTRDLLLHKFGPEALPLEKQEKEGVAGHNPNEWKKTVLATRDGQLYIEPTYIFACIRDGARNIKKGARGTLAKDTAATLQVADDRVLLDRWMPEGRDIAPPLDPDEPVYLHVSGVRIGTARHVRYRVAAGKGWRTEFTIIWDNTIVSRDQMKSAIIDAGRLCGLADGRQIGFGRFVVEEMEIEDYAKTQTA